MSFDSFSIKTSVGFLMNLRQVSLMSWASVAVNIITYLLWGVSLKIFWTSDLMPNQIYKVLLLTDVIKEFITFIQNENLKVFHWNCFGLH